ncbi:unnamed protein product [Vitrella brassicaformis CCMP3155]|uniref:Amino acid permease/ SLC12A domain-containing protein n=1 Tax=Vitrella brassicaformis (strain CCMP3155) TaxID=1169540 RepID=A0A0G4FMY0_VITBC|nr:unnamed protein product [Vitrella brassicaformis CCMP3155]|eukprot:CEM15539.1 unnamed protein product [Vitrella brassicaformis CCMP3155]
MPSLLTWFFPENGDSEATLPLLSEERAKAAVVRRALSADGASEESAHYAAERGSAKASDSDGDGEVGVGASIDPAKGKQRRILGCTELVAMLFFCNGGPFGVEESVQLAGPLLAVCGAVLMPLLWALPVGLMTSELTSRYPYMGSQVVAVEKTLGPFTSFIFALFSGAANQINMASIPPLLLSYLEPLWATQPPSLRMALRVALPGVLLLIMLVANYRGVRLVGRCSEILVCVSLTTVGAFTTVAIRHLLSHGHVLEAFEWLHPTTSVRLPTLTWSTFVSLLVWNSSGFDQAASCGGEVHRPSRSFPRAMTVALLLSTCSMVIPLAASVGYFWQVRLLQGHSPWLDLHQWQPGFYSQLAHEMGGAPFAQLIGITGASLAFGQLIVLGCAYSREFAAICSTSTVLPSWIGALHPQYGTPYRVIAASTLLTAVLCCINDFSKLVNAAMYFDALALTVFLTAFLVLRLRGPTDNDDDTAPLRRSTTLSTEISQPPDNNPGSGREPLYHVPGGLMATVPLCAACILPSLAMIVLADKWCHIAALTCFIALSVFYICRSERQEADMKG